MSVSVNGPKTPLTKGSNGVATATLPNICKMPGPPAPFVPAPLPNIGKTGDKPKGYSKKVKIENKAVAIKGASFGSMGDMASKGTGGGLISANTHGPCKFISPGSMDVKFEGGNVHLLSDMVTNNGGGSGSPANAATMMGTIQTTGSLLAVPKMACPICQEEHVELEETPKTKTSAGGLAANFNTEVQKAMLKVKSLAPPATMLGVVECKCGKKYADQSGTTTRELCTAATGEGMKHPPAVTKSYEEGGPSEEDYEDTLEITKLGIMGHIGSGGVVGRIFEMAEVRARKSLEGGRTSYPPGNCAAQKTLLLLLEDHALVAAMTEQWYSAEGKKGRWKGKRKPTKGKIEHIDLRKGPDVIPAEFNHGDSVPPCGSCELIVPLLLCTQGETKCQHKS